MPWKKAAALGRINKLQHEVPEFDVQKFEQYWPLYESNRKAHASQDRLISPPLFNLAKGKAVVVDTVQLYITITNYDDFRLEDGLETEAAQERALRLLHLYYSVADRVIGDSGAQRVDFHNGRVHAVLLEKANSGVTKTTIAQAFALIEDFKLVAAMANRELVRDQFNMSFRVGIDIGTCVAINNGTGCEQEPMFLGSAANHAAKLASGNEPGVYVSDRVRKILSIENVGLLSEGVSLSENQISTNVAYRDASNQPVFGIQNRQPYAQKIVENWRNDIREGHFLDITDPVFKFTYKEPPLSELDYSVLMPSRSIRMPLVSMFADLSGYTAYIDKAVISGNIQNAVRALYVMRQEFQNVVEKDFGGRKVRFIGDCIHAVIAEGSNTETDLRESVSLAAQCAGGLFASFEVCKTVLGDLDELGLAIGLELGETPISRIGIRGDRSVRIASSVTTTRSEQMQRECEHNGVKLGPRARQMAPAALVEDLLDETGYSVDMDYDELAVCLSKAPATVSSPTYLRAHTPPDTTQHRAHLLSE